MGVIVLLGLTASTLGITSNLYSMEKSHWNVSDCKKIHHQPSFNQTLCSYIKLFQLPDEYFVTVCKYNGRILLDIRQFLNRHATWKGISLSMTQWNYILSIRHHITKAIYDARNV